MIKVLFFAQLREQLQCAQWECAPGAVDVASLREQLVAERPDWKDHLMQPSLLMAVNQRLVKVSCPLNDGDEVAFFPPVTGG